MAKLEIKGLEEWIIAVERLEKNSDEICEKALKDAAEVVKEKYITYTSAIPTDEKWGIRKYPKKGIREFEKKDLLKSLGITPINKDKQGNLDIKVGYHQYNEKGIANQLIARASNSGTSFMKKSGFMDKANRVSKPLAKEIIQKSVEDEIRRLTK